MDANNDITELNLPRDDVDYDDDEEEDDRIIETDGDSTTDDDDDDDNSMDDGNNSMDDDSSDESSDDDDDDDSDNDSEESVVPTPDEVEVEYTYPDDFRDRGWRDVIEEGQYCRLIINCEAVHDIPAYKFVECCMLIEIVFLHNNDNKQNNILRYIGQCAFDHCKNLQRIRNGLPVGLVELGREAFQWCTSLQQGLTIPRSVLLIDFHCFFGCSSITTVDFDHLPTDAVDLRAYIFAGCSELRSVTLPPSLPSIPSCCFYGCVLLIHVPIPITVRVIERAAFCGCSALRHIDLSENITEIQDNAYTSCSSLTTVTIRSSTVQFGESVLALCPSLSTIKIYPWVLPRLFAAMNGPTTDASNFRNELLRKSQHQLAQFRR